MQHIHNQYFLFVLDYIVYVLFFFNIPNITFPVKALCNVKAITKAAANTCHSIARRFSSVQETIFKNVCTAAECNQYLWTYAGLSSAWISTDSMFSHMYLPLYVMPLPFCCFVRSFQFIKYLKILKVVFGIVCIVSAEPTTVHWYFSCNHPKGHNGRTEYLNDSCRIHV